MRVIGITGINRRLRRFGQKLNTAQYLLEPRVDVLCIPHDDPIPARIGVRVKDGYLVFGIKILTPPQEHFKGPFLSSTNSFVDEASMDTWWQSILEMRDLCQNLTEEKHQVIY